MPEMQTSIQTKNNYKCSRFFRHRLMHLNRDEIKTMTDSMETERMDIPFNAQKIAWYMRGGVDFTDIMNMSTQEIDNLNKIIDDNLETTKKTKLPFF